VVKEDKHLPLDARRDYYLLKTYGIDSREYDRLLADQGGVCLLCGKKPGRIRLAVDHDHEIKRKYGVIVVRGLIHSRCNTALGVVEWSDETIKRWIKYLRRIIVLREKYRGEESRKEQNG
jgi:hypothetical protein